MKTSVDITLTSIMLPLKQTKKTTGNTHSSIFLFSVKFVDVVVCKAIEGFGATFLAKSVSSAQIFLM